MENGKVMDDSSFQAHTRFPTTRRLSSTDYGWSSLLFDRLRLPPGFYEFDSLETMDVQIGIGLEGVFGLKTSRTKRAESIFAPGSLGLLSGGDTLKTRVESPHGYEMGHLFLPHGVVQEAAETLRKAGQRTSSELISKCPFYDPTLAAALTSLSTAFEAKMPDLYAEQAAHWMAVHILLFHGTQSYGPAHANPGVLSDKRLSRILEFINASLATDLTLERMSREAGVSKFHFVRLFKLRTGLTPARYVERLRMERARELLTGGDAPISTIASLLGFRRAEQFSAAFQRHYGISPSTLRRSTPLEPRK